MSKNTDRKLRSQEWYSGHAYENYARRAWLRSEGFPADVFQNKPVIGICNSWSELNNCNAHLRTVAEAVKRGVWAAGGVPLEFPTISLGEMFMRPTTMLYRNLMAMDVEESIRANPIDGVVLLCGCDKTTPAQLMGAASADIPAIVVPGGPMLSGQWKDRRLGSGTDGRKLFDLFRTGRVSEEEWWEIEGGISRSAGHCTVMGTASTMTSLAEALGMTLTGCANIPAPDSRRLAIAEMSGRRMVDMVWEDLRPSQIMTRQALENAMTVDMAIGGSTNAVVHLIAIAGRLGIALDLRRFRYDFPAHSLDRQREAVGRIPHGGLLLCRRTAGGDEGDLAPAARRRAHRDRQDHSREPGAGGVPPARSDSHRRRTAASRGRYRGALRQSGARWRSPKANRRIAAASAAPRARATCSRIISRCARRSIARTCPSIKTLCW